MRGGRMEGPKTSICSAARWCERGRPRGNSDAMGLLAQPPHCASRRGNICRIEVPGFSAYPHNRSSVGSSSGPSPPPGGRKGELKMGGGSFRVIRWRHAATAARLNPMSSSSYSRETARADARRVAFIENLYLLRKLCTEATGFPRFYRRSSAGYTKMPSAAPSGRKRVDKIHTLRPSVSPNP